MNNAGTRLIQTEMESLLYGNVVEKINIDIGPWLNDFYILL